LLALFSHEERKPIKTVFSSVKKYSKGRILVVDDEPHVRKVVKMTLEKAGYDVRDAEDGSRLFKK